MVFGRFVHVRMPVACVGARAVLLPDEEAVQARFFEVPRRDNLVQTIVAMGAAGMARRDRPGCLDPPGKPPYKQRSNGPVAQR